MPDHGGAGKPFPAVRLSGGPPAGADFQQRGIHLVDNEVANLTAEPSPSSDEQKLSDIYLLLPREKSVCSIGSGGGNSYKDQSGTAAAYKPQECEIQEWNHRDPISHSSYQQLTTQQQQQQQQQHN